MNEKKVAARGAEIATEAFGDPKDPAIVLVMGLMASMLWWPDDLCKRLAGGGRYVIRYDNRDTGRSTWSPQGEPAYSFDDMADDVARVLDGYGIAVGHVAGMSMGGMLAQMAALEHPKRFASLTVISSSPIGEDTSKLPGSSPAYNRHFAAFPQIDFSDRAQAVAFLVEDARQTAGPAHPFDEAEVRRFVERDFDRAVHFGSVANHVAVKGEKDFAGRLRGLTVPLLVIHGTADPIFPIEHALGFADAVPSATIVRLEGGGHELHRGHWDRIVEAILAHTATP
jgi:pimeloyl-ACP methyl ester carboxylesterase